MEKFRKANSGDLSNSTHKSSLDHLARTSDSGVAERSIKTPAEIKLNEHDESLMDDILAST
jgi:hypothetical protein